MKRKMTIVCTPSFRNCIFPNLTFLKHHKKNLTIISFCNTEVVKNAAKSLENMFTNKIIVPKNYFE